MKTEYIVVWHDFESNFVQVGPQWSRLPSEFTSVKNIHDTILYRGTDRDIALAVISGHARNSRTGVFVRVYEQQVGTEVL